MQNDLINEIGTNFIEYAVAVNTDRALPDAKSGLKPVARRILFDCYDNKLFSNKPHVKAAKIVGDVMGRLHPHGDSSIYGALVRISQDWVMRYPLIDWHGNNGNIIGDGPAAMRYTETRLSKLSEDGMLSGLQKNNVDFIPNFDETMEEPVTLPAIFPNLLCNPNTGIGVAMACNWLPHNLREVSAAIGQYLDGQEPMLPGPDFPTGGIITNKDDIPIIMRTGHGSVSVRGKYHIDKKKIIFTEIPYGTTIEGLLNQIAEFCNNGDIPEIIDVHDETNKNGIKIVIECDKPSSIDKVIKALFMKTDLQTSISYNQVALIDKTPTDLNLKKCIEIYVNHNLDCQRREAEYDINKAKGRLEIVNGLLKALEDIDNVIALIKKSESAAAAKINLIGKYGLTEVQAKAILDMKLSRLAKLEALELNNEKADLEKIIKDLNTLLASEDMQKSLLRKRLQNLVDKYGDDRRTELTQITKEVKEKEAIPVEDVVVIYGEDSLRRVPRASFKIANRNTKGTKSDSAMNEIIVTNTEDTLMLFSNLGRMYRLSVYNVPSTAAGASINSLISLAENENIVQVTSMNSDTYQFIVFVTKCGLIKKSALTEYKDTKRATGCKVIEFNEGDELVDVKLIEKDCHIVVGTYNGKGIHFTTLEVGATGKASKGIKAIKLDDGDYIVDFTTVTDVANNLIVITADGKGKQIPMSDVPLQARAGKGVMIIGKDQHLGSLCTAITGATSLIVYSPVSSLKIAISDIPLSSRTAQGNILLKGENVKGIICP